MIARPRESATAARAGVDSIDTCGTGICMDLSTIREHLGFSLFMIAGAAFGMGIVQLLYGLS
jgi:hypothetical protein